VLESLAVCDDRVLAEVDGDDDDDDEVVALVGGVDGDDDMGAPVPEAFGETTGPIGPRGLGPGGPAGPCLPSEPFKPRGPGGPVGPMSPFGPGGPAGPLRWRLLLIRAGDEPPVWLSLRLVDFWVTWLLVDDNDHISTVMATARAAL
jgi:hypothetical protein